MRNVIKHTIAYIGLLILTTIGLSATTILLVEEFSYDSDIDTLVNVLFNGLNVAYSNVSKIPVNEELVDKLLSIVKQDEYRVLLHKLYEKYRNVVANNSCVEIAYSYSDEKLVMYLLFSEADEYDLCMPSDVVIYKYRRNETYIEVTYLRLR